MYVEVEVINNFVGTIERKAERNVQFNTIFFCKALIHSINFTFTMYGTVRYGTVRTENIMNNNN